MNQRAQGAQGAKAPQQKRTGITTQQAALFANAVQRVQSAQAEVNAMAGAILAGRGIEAAMGVQLDWSKPKTPFLVYQLPAEPGQQSEQ